MSQLGLLIRDKTRDYHRLVDLLKLDFSRARRLLPVLSIAVSNESYLGAGILAANQLPLRVLHWAMRLNLLRWLVREVVPSLLLYALLFHFA